MSQFDGDGILPPSGGNTIGTPDPKAISRVIGDCRKATNLSHVVSLRRLTYFEQETSNECNYLLDVGQFL